MVTLGYIIIYSLFSEMIFLFLCLILALSANVVESEICKSRGELRNMIFPGPCMDCDTIQICTNVTDPLEWTIICFDEDWDQNTFNVYCRQFGYSGANPIGASRTCPITGNGCFNNVMKLSSLNCAGDESDLLSCGYTITDSRCDYLFYDLPNQCYNKTDSPIDSSSSTLTPSISSSSSALSSNVVMDTTANLATQYPTISSYQLSSSFFSSTYGTQATSTSLRSSHLTLTTIPLTSVEIPSTPTSIINNVISHNSVISTSTNSIANDATSLTTTLSISSNSLIPTSTPSTSIDITSTLSISSLLVPTPPPNTTPRISIPSIISTTASAFDCTNCFSSSVVTNTAYSTTFFPSTYTVQPTSTSSTISASLTNPDTPPTTSTSSGDDGIKSSIPSESNGLSSTSTDSIPNDVTSTSTSSSSDLLVAPTPPPITPPSPVIPSDTSTTSALYCTDCFSSSVVTSTTYSTTFFPSTSTVQATSTGIPSTTSTTPSSSLSTQSVASTQQSRMSLMLIPILVPIIAILVILTILTIVILVLSCIFCSRRKRTKGSTDNDETAIYAELSGIPSLNSQVENQNTVFLNGDPNYTAINETSLMDRDYAYAEIGKRTLDSEDVQEYLAPINDNYSSIDNELYGHLVEGEVSNYNLYEQLPRMDQVAYHKFVAVSSTLENPLYDILVKESPNKEPIYIEPPSSLPQLENVFGQCLNEIRRKDIQMGEEFASGQFGVVYRAVYHTEKGDIPVAIKTLKEAANTDTKVAFMREAAILAQFQHPNVLRMIGVLTTQQPYMMVTELLKTELADLLLKMKSADPAHRQNLPSLLLRFCQEIAAGMKHLSEKHFIHRDLAARNVLVAKDLSCRIADFGMSRELHSDSEYYTSSGGRVPLRWTAPEAVFYNKYSEKSDVWSFGMTMYEIWSLGDKPWGLYTSNDEIVEGMSQGKKLSPPTGCPRDVYRVMVETWRADASFRPTFSDAQVMLTDAQLLPPIPGVNEPSLCLGNDPALAQDLYLDLQLVK